METRDSPLGKHFGETGGKQGQTEIYQIKSSATIPINLRLSRILTRA
jgi:hypothetical protein